MTIEKGSKAHHPHRHPTADDAAVETLLSKITTGSGSTQRRREKLLEALEEAVEQYRGAAEKERKAFFHGMLTGYAVALKLW